MNKLILTTTLASVFLTGCFAAEAPVIAQNADKPDAKDKSGVSKVALTFLPPFASVPANNKPAENIVYPADAGLVDVTQEPYNLKGDGATDNTVALRQAFADNRGSNKTLYFPNGVYLISDRINISGDEKSTAHSKDRFLNLQGQSEAGSIIKLADNAAGYGDVAAPKNVISLYDGQSTGDVMHSYVCNLTFDVGAGNPGAAALRYISNNTGAITNVTIRSSDPNRAGAIGLDLRQSQQGPAFVKNVTVDGFARGIEMGNSFSMVFEHIRLFNQSEAGFVNNNGRTTIRDLQSQSRVPALANGKNGEVTLIEAQLQGEGAVAIESENTKLFLRDIRNVGYNATLQTKGGEMVRGDLTEWFAGQSKSLFDAPKTSLRLPIEETPEIPWQTDLSKWVKVEADRPNSIQDAIDEAARYGKTTVYFPKIGKKNAYVISKPIRVHGSVNRILGMDNILWIDGESDLTPDSVVFTFEDLSGPVVIERFFNILKLNDWKGLYDRYLFESKSKYPVVVRHLAHGACSNKKPSPGTTWFIEDIAGARMAQFGKGEKVWMRQYNPESPELNMCEVAGGQAWILGLKTEGRARHIVATDGASVEVLGGVSYQSWKNQKLDPPMFTVDNSRASFTLGFYSWIQPFTTIVEEKEGGETRALGRKEAGGFLSLYRAGGK